MSSSVSPFEEQNLGTRVRIIVSDTHRLVVELSLIIKKKLFCFLTKLFTIKKGTDI